MSGSGESNQYAVPAPAGAARVMNTYAGAPPAPPARGRGREGDAGGRREVGHAGMPARGGAEWDAQPHERAPEGGTLTSVSDERREEEEEPAAEAALLCSARRTDQFCGSQHYFRTLFSKKTIDNESEVITAALLTAEGVKEEEEPAAEAAPLCCAWRMNQSCGLTFVLKKTTSNESEVMTCDVAIRLAHFPWLVSR